MPPSVAIIGTRGYPSYYGGFETAVRKLAPYLAERGWDVTVYGREGSTKPDDPARNPRVETVTTRGVESRSLSTLSYGLTAALHAGRRKPDVALVMNVANGYFLPVLRSRGIPSLVNVDGMEWQRAKWGRLARAVFRGGARFTVRFANRLVYDSTEIARLWKAEFHREGDFIPYGGDITARPFATSTEKHVLVVARLVPENSIREFLEAAWALSERWKVVIVGSAGYGGELEARVRDLADSRENVEWLGHVSDDAKLMQLWQGAGAYFHGHSVGGTNPALVQAMAAGAPIVARDTVFTREVLADAALFAEATPESIVEKIDELMGNTTLQKTLSERAVARAKTDYSWDAVCAAYERALLELIDEREGA